MRLSFDQREFYSALCPEVWSVVDGKCSVTGSEWMDAAEKARKKAEKEAAKTASLTKEDKFDAFGNKIEEKKVATKIPKAELKKLKKRVAELRKKGQEVWTDEEIEKEGARRWKDPGWRSPQAQRPPAFPRRRVIRRALLFRLQLC